jgi:hypothetical protein
MRLSRSSLERCLRVRLLGARFLNFFFILFHCATQSPTNSQQPIKNHQPPQ